MKRPIAAFLAVAFFVVMLLAQTTALTALHSPVDTPDSAPLVSPLGTPLPHWDPSYNPHPKKVTPRAVPFVNQDGETIIQEYIIS